MDENEVFKRLEEILGKEYHPLICKARNAIALQKLAERQIKRTIKGNVIIEKEQNKMISLVNSANYALEGLIKYLVKGKEDPLADLLSALRDSDNQPKVKESE